MRKITWEYLSLIEVEQIRDEEIPHISFSEIINELTLDDILKKQETDEWYEGFVVTYENWDKIKFKLLSYVKKHKAKEDINNPKRLIQICLDEQTDDLRTLFEDDKIALNIIDGVEKQVFHYYNHIVSKTRKEFNKYSNLHKKFKETNDDILKKELRKEVSCIKSMVTV